MINFLKTSILKKYEVDNVNYSIKIKTENNFYVVALFFKSYSIDSGELSESIVDKLQENFVLKKVRYTWFREGLLISIYLNDKK